MAKQYRLTRSRRMVNSMAARFAKRGRGQSWILTTIGRSSGQRREVVITPVVIDGVRYLVGPYGAVGWVKNLRANPRATVSHGGTSVRIEAVAVEGEEAGRALARYYSENERYVAAYMDIAGDHTIYDFIAAAERYPVFRADEASGILGV